MAYFGGELAPWFRNEPNHRAMRNMVRVAIDIGKQAAAKFTPRDTGHLAGAWEVEQDIKRRMTFLGAAWQADWFNPVEYALYVEHGTGLFGPEHKKYLILPREPGGVLHWVDRITGEDVFARSVLHPGSPGAHMLAKSAQVVDKTWPRAIRGVLRNWEREIDANADTDPF